MKKRNCIICGKPLNSGIILYGSGICKSCEEKIVKSQVDTDLYEYFKKCIKKTIVRSLIKGEDFNCQNYHF